MNLSTKIVLASGSMIRGNILRSVGLEFEVVPADIDEDSTKKRMRLEGFTSLETAQTRADLKACEVSKVHTSPMVMFHLA